ncbi:MAG: hypothetical protein IE911_15560, partial [Brevundimonas sp.]|nr:hypothetical protein [Brevundimonas sp.]
MTQEPPEQAPEAAPEETAAQVRRKRSLPQLIALIAGGIVGGVLVLALIALIGGRMYIVSDAGRELVSGFVQGQKISRYGRINVYGLKGDLFDDFTLERVTVTDRDGVWLDARNVRVDWSYWPLVTRRFHATEISADVIRLIRRPILDAPSGEPGGPQPIDVDIDKFSARVELLEGFSKEYGRWDLSGMVDLPRRGAKHAELKADSLNRPGDLLRLAATFGGKLEDTRVDLRAKEAQGGPLAGALGYSPDEPFSAVAVVNADLVRAKVQTGRFVPLTVDGRFGEAGSRVSGYFDFSGSDLFAPFVERVGRTARFGFAMVPAKDKAF